MYTRSRHNQAYPRNQTNINPGFQGQNTYNQAGGFQGAQPLPPQQSNYKPGNAQNSPGFKPQQQQGHQAAQNSPAFKPQQQQTQQSTQNSPAFKPQQQQAQQPAQNSPVFKPQQMQPQQPTQNSSVFKQQQAQQPTQNSPALKPQQQQAQQAAPRNIQQPNPALTTLQMQQQQLKQQQQQQQQKQPQVKQEPPQSPVSNLSPQVRLKPILKQTTQIVQAATPVSQPTGPSPTPAPVPAPTPAPTSVPVSSNAAEANDGQSENTDVEMLDQYPRWRRKMPGFKVNKRLKRLRMNQRLRKTLQPKNAIMVLNEMKAGVQFTFPETQGPMPSSLYLVHAELDGKTYVGQGLSKPLARQNAAENALKALLLEKMTAATMKARMDAETDGQLSQSADSSTSLMKEDNSEVQGTPMETNIDESEEIPWSSLASFALYKLFLEWHNQGTSVPVPRPGLPSPAKGVKKDVPPANKTPVQKELPPNATTIHPVMLLNQMRPGLTYVEMSRVGNPPNTMFTLAVEIDGVEFTGTAKNKKDAKKVAAKSALLVLYGLDYPDETQSIQDQPLDVQMG